MAFLVTATSVNKRNVSMYSVAVHVDSNANLKALATSAGGLEPAFAPTTMAYKCAPPFGTKDITVTPTSDDGDATIEVRTALGLETRTRRLSRFVFVGGWQGCQVGRGERGD